MLAKPFFAAGFHRAVRREPLHAAVLVGLDRERVRVVRDEKIRDVQIAKSKEGAETLRVTIAGRFTAAPGDIAAVSGTKIGIVGNFRVIECVRRFGESGEACEVTMQRE